MRCGTLKSIYLIVLCHVVVEIFSNFKSMHLSNLPRDRRSSYAVKNVHWEVLDNYSEE